MANVPDPLVSCIMPAGNGAELLLQSIECFRHQDYRNRELIIVDDSVDGLAAALPEDRRIHYLRVPNGVPLGGKRNYGLHHAQGEILAFWDVDSWSGPGRLRRQIQPLLAGEADVTGLQTGFSRTSTAARWFFNGPSGSSTATDIRKLLSEDDGTAFLKHVLARGARLLAISGEGLLKIAEPPMSGVTSELLVMPPPRGRRPFVSCIMPTANRREFVGRAVRQFLEQDYPNRELLIVDDGEGSAPDLPTDSSNIRYFRLGQRSRVGTKRNYACEQARGEIIVHWDDDDWMAPWRLSYQVEELLASGADACGLNRLYFYEPQSRQAWDYIYPPGEPPWLAGGTLCYWKKFRDRNRFPDLQVGEDNSFVWSPAAKRLHAHPDRGFYAALIHSGNTSPKLIAQDRWRPGGFSGIGTSAGKQREAFDPQTSPRAIRLPPLHRNRAVFAEHSIGSVYCRPCGRSEPDRVSRAESRARPPAHAAVGDPVCDFPGAPLRRHGSPGLHVESGRIRARARGTLP